MAFKKFTDILEDNQTTGKAALYVRVSTLMQADRDSIPMQKKDLINYAKIILGIDDYVIFEDAGFSGKNTKRPAFQEMMTRIRQGEFTHMLVWKLDRISRNLLDFAEMYAELQKYKCIFVSKNEQFQTDSPMGKAMLRMIMVFAEMEREVTAERVSSVMNSRAIAGKWNGGRIPMGYDRDSENDTFSINPDESKIIEKIYNEYTALKSLTTVAKRLNKECNVPRYGTKWTPASVHRILTNPWYYGDYVYNRYNGASRFDSNAENEWIVNKNHHPAIITKELYDKANEILQLNKRQSHVNKAKNTAKFIHIFQGIVKCDECDTYMTCSHGTLRVSGMKGTKYICPNRRKNSSSCKATSDVVIGPFIFNYLKNMMDANNHPDEIESVADLQVRLLQGFDFENVKHIERHGLNTTYNMIKDNLPVQEYIVNTVDADKRFDAEQLSKLKTEKSKKLEALSRLKDLYLYQDAANPLSAQEYYEERDRIIEAIEEYDAQITILLQDNEYERTISDDDLIRIASNFIIQQQLANYEYIDFESLALYTDRTLLKMFIQSTVSEIRMRQGKVVSILFKNGVLHKFEYKEDQ